MRVAEMLFSYFFTKIHNKLLKNFTSLRKSDILYLTKGGKQW